MSNFKLHNGDCLEVLKTFEDNCIDSVVTDPPYGLSAQPDIAEVMKHWIAGTKYEHSSSGFMGKSWDSFVPNPDIWKEVYRVMKPGAHALVFAGTRTQDLMSISLRFAGFEIRDVCMWLYGTGFPKSLNISKAIDKTMGLERKVIGHAKTGGYARQIEANVEQGFRNTDYYKDRGNLFTSNDPISDEAKLWNEYGTALKPAYEPILIAYKNEDYDIDNEFYYIERFIWQSLEKLEKTDMFNSQEMVSIHLNIVLLWHSILVEFFQKTSMFITSTKTKVTTELKILSCLLKQNIQEDITKEEMKIHGFLPLVHAVVSSLKEEKKSMKDIQNVIAQELAIYRKNKNFIHVRNVQQDLLPIIQVANSVLLNVFTLIGQESKEVNLLEFANFVEKNLQQYHQDQQNTATNSAWQMDTEYNAIIIAMKPLDKNFVNNALKHGVAGLNIDGSRIAGEWGGSGNRKNSPDNSSVYAKYNAIQTEQHSLGRFPANIILDEESGKILDEQAGERKSGKLTAEQRVNGSFAGTHGIYGSGNKVENAQSYESSKGGASRFFYSAKTSTSERNLGCENMKEQQVNDGRETSIDNAFQRGDTMRKNIHPTVKPISLMKYLCNLVKTPTGGVVLDPFMGSGSTGMACAETGQNFIGIELSPEYFEIAKARIETMHEEKKNETPNLLNIL